MVFSSHLFIFYFLPAALALYYLMPRRGKHLLLTIASYVFYGWANPYFVLLMLYSTLIDYVCGLQLARQFRREAWSQPVPLLERNSPRSRGQKAAVVISIVQNLALLGFFKYFNFATESYDALAGWLGFPNLRLDLAFKITLPLGISFYTFQSMSYSIDVYRGDARAIRNFTDFACYVAMFPQLVAGPIIRFSEVADQMMQRTHTLEKFARGIAFFTLGLAKKVLLANPCGKVADTVFNAGSAGCADSWFGVLSYSFQIYFDFSGYSDMAIGLGLMFGFVFAKNFDSPYHSQSITEFWRRWHLSLSTWLRDYLYIPLGGNKHGPVRTYVNLFLVMFLGGLWHGAAWNFVAWGAMHGILLAFERFWNKRPVYHFLPRPLRVGLTYVLVLFTWVFFRAKDLPAAVAYLKSMLGLGTAQDGAGLLQGILYKPYYLLTFALCAVIVWFAPQAWDWSRKITGRKALAVIVLLWLSIVVLSTQAYNPFIYFIF
ncbi:MAG TPA: MBOAT family O-acyltransferase [Kiritimatiellia bacterium]|nr:MBOAT family O-acyltransferase [Kiritimatiellia bacterium]HRZ12173.1 MBOAT family O-acyltransferase [Kiritimatiellia bacterium]HSA18069.1 MBOAT family O-acyltransferase [Kiritimatiellia bacterium]